MKPQMAPLFSDIQHLQKNTIKLRLIIVTVFTYTSLMPYCSCDTAADTATIGIGNAKRENVQLNLFTN